MPTPGRFLQLSAGCVALGAGVTLLLLSRLGSDGFSTLVYGVSLATDFSFLGANAVVAACFLAMAWARGIRPGIGTLVQILLVGGVVDVGLALAPTPEALWVRGLLALAALPVLAVGIAAYLGTHLGAGPVEAAALAWEPPLRFAVSYNTVQLLSAVVGWLLGASLGVATVAVVVLLGPLVTVATRLLHLDVHHRRPRESGRGRPG